MVRRRNMRVLGLALSVALVFAWGCSAEEMATGCLHDTDCDGQKLCWPASGECMLPAQELSMGLEVRAPENNQGWVTQEFIEGEREIQIRSAISLQGAVVASDNLDEPLLAHVRVWRPSRIDGRPTVMAETSTNDIEAQDNFGYALWLAPEHHYSVFATPEPPFDSALPPALEGGLELVEHTKKDIILDGADRAVEVHGRVVDANGRPLPYSVAVRAAHDGGWLRSTPAKTCAENTPETCVDEAEKRIPLGHFAFRIPFGVKTYTLYVEPLENATRSPDEKVPQLPVMKCSGAVLGLTPSPSGPDTPKPAVMELSDPLQLPPFPQAEEFQLPVVGENGEPVVGATVILAVDLPIESSKASSYDLCTASYKRTTITDAEGMARLWLLPGSAAEARIYRLTVVSPPTNPHRSYASTQYAVVRTLGGLLPELELTRRHELSGHVVDSHGEPVPGARIEAEGVLATDVAVGVPPTSTSTETNDNGEFILYVDPGTFHFNITPREGSALPRFSLLNKDIGASSTGLELTTPPARLWRGRLLLPPTKADSQAAGAAGFTVNAYATVPKSTTQNNAALRASCVTDDAGSFLLVLPARL
ncbi:MAG: hypothetical protein JRH20_15630 [Deltaproteobacteria bacterium]|nr:hypothetical protein [Deltaproteobacteria bacterium]